jgi:hypothetical protein
MKRTVDSVYVMYVLSSGHVDDLSDSVRLLKERDWQSLAIQVKIVSLNNSSALDTLHQKCLKLN